MGMSLGETLVLSRWLFDVSIDIERGITIGVELSMSSDDGVKAGWKLVKFGNGDNWSVVDLETRVLLFVWSN